MRLSKAAGVLFCASLIAPSAQGEAATGAQWYLAALAIDRTWTVSTGAGVIIGVVDSAIDRECPSIRGSLLPDLDQSVSPVRESHGTEVTSLIVGNGDASGGQVRGVAPDARVLSVGVPFEPDAGDRIAAAIRVLVDHGVSILNLSLADDSARVQLAVDYAIRRDVVVVAAAGNTFATGPEMTKPARYGGVLAVTGVDRSLAPDPASAKGSDASVAAPMSTAPADPTTGSATHGLRVSEPGSGFRDNAVGTSFASAIVAGIVALVRSRWPRITAAAVLARVLATRRPGRVIDAWSAVTSTLPELGSAHAHESDRRCRPYELLALLESAVLLTCLAAFARRQDAAAIARQHADDGR